jgi:hypothetical protein
MITTQPLPSNGRCLQSHFMQDWCVGCHIIVLKYLCCFCNEFLKEPFQSVLQDMLQIHPAIKKYMGLIILLTSNHHMLTFCSWSGTSCIVWVFWAFTKLLWRNQASLIIKRSAGSAVPLWADCNTQWWEFMHTTESAGIYFWTTDSL